VKREIVAVAVVVCALGVDGTAYQDITKLKDESITESLAKLSDVNVFQAPTHEAFGAKAWIPLSAELDQDDLQAIMTSRPFRKVFEYLSSTNKAAAAQIVNRELSAGITEYLNMYEAEMLRTSSYFTLGKLAGRKDFSGPVFAIRVPEGEVVIRGARFRVLALVWTSGMLGLTGTKDQVERAARLAVKQRTDLYDDQTLHPFYKREMLREASLYNRQILSSGLLGVAGNRDLEASAIKAVGVEWQERRLTLYNDLSGAREPDYSLGSLTVRFTAPMDDAHFDLLLKELHLAQETGNPDK
jgi:hypothetical protein